MIISSVFFALYGLSSIAMIVIVFSILFQIFDRTSLASLYKYFIAIGLLVVFKGICNMVADMKKHSAGFDIVQQIRERMIIKLKKFSLGFYTNERLGEINTILHKDVDNMSLVVGHMWSRMFGDFFDRCSRICWSCKYCISNFLLLWLYLFRLHLSFYI